MLNHKEISDCHESHIELVNGQIQNNSWCLHIPAVENDLRTKTTRFWISIVIPFKFRITFSAPVAVESIWQSDTSYETRDIEIKALKIAC